MQNSNMTAGQLEEIELLQLGAKFIAQKNEEAQRTIDEIINEQLKFDEMHLKLREAIDSIIKKDSKKKAKLEGYYEAMFELCGIRPPNWYL